MNIIKSLFVLLFLLTFTVNSTSINSGKIIIKNNNGDIVGVENGGLDTNLQDQVSRPVSFPFLLQKNVTTLAQDVSIGSYTVIVTSSSGFAVGDTLGIFSSGSFYFGKILNIATNTITLDSPLDIDFTTGATILDATDELSVAGSTGSPITFAVQAGGASSTNTLDITKIVITMTTSSAVDLNKFGNITALTNGLVLRKNDGIKENYANFKTNRDISNIAGNLTVYTASNPAQGIDGFNSVYTFAGQSNHGVAVRLLPGEKLELIISDDLSSITSFKVIAQGHIVIN